MNDWKKRMGMVYTTSDDFDYDYEEKKEEETPPPSEQNLRVWLDRRQRAGKQVTLVKGFVGSDDDLNELSTLLKRRCGTGGTAKDGEVIIQGDFRDRIVDILTLEGKKKKKAGG